MSTTELKIICDLCKEQISKSGGVNRSCLNAGIIASKPHAKTNRWTFLPNWWGENAKRFDSKNVQWDFHTSCLTDLLRPLVEGEQK